MPKFRTLPPLAFAAAFAAAVLAPAAPASAELPVFEITLRDHRFEPAELAIPAGQKVELHITNFDATPEEFESPTLRREKLVPAGQKAIIYVGPLAPGRYEYFGDFNPKIARGVIVVQ